MACLEAKLYLYCIPDFNQGLDMRCVFLSTFVLIFFFFTQLTSKEIQLETLYGTIKVTDPLIIDLLESVPMQRIKKIDQHGVVYFQKNSPTFNRYEHCIGVYYLLKQFNLPLIEQAAGLVHDVSHTVFSHLSDLIFEHDDVNDPYQDSIHYWYLEKSNLRSVVSKYNYTLEHLSIHDDYFGLEQPLPDICADRLEYNLHTGYAFNLLTKADIQIILNDLSFEDNKWFFKTPSIAKKFASLSLYFTEHFWGEDSKVSIYKFASLAVQRAINLNLISFDDIHFSNDAAVLEKLQESSDSLIQSYLSKCSHIKNNYKIGSKEDYNYLYHPKFRGINPLVKVDGYLVRLSSLDQDFAEEFQRVKEQTKQGLFLVLDYAI